MEASQGADLPATAGDGVREAYRETLPGVEVTLRFLGSCLLEEPSPGYMGTIMEPGLWDGLPFGRQDDEARRGLSMLGAWCARADADGEALDELRRAWFRLFVGAGRPVAAPWQSVYTDDESLMFTEETRDVRAWYRRFGLEPARLNREPDDHIGLMLEFLASLASCEQRCGCDVEMAGLQRDQLDFISRHVDVFLSDWARDVVEKGGNEFYAGLALVVSGVVRARTAQLEASPWLIAGSE